MDIKYLGHASFRLRGKNASIITDPFDPDTVGLPFSKKEADIVTLSHKHKDHSAIERIGGEPIVLNGPGEYEIRGIRICGYRTFHDNKKGKERGLNTAYLFEIDRVRIVHLGDLGHELQDALLDELDGVDILLIPTGGVYTINEKQAVKIVRMIEPKIVVPMHFKQAGMKEAFDGLSTADAFVKEIDKQVDTQAKLTVSRDTLPSEMKVVMLETKS